MNSFIYERGCMYIKNNGDQCQREALQGYNYCKQHLNIYLKKHNMPQIPTNKRTKRTKRAKKNINQTHFPAPLQTMGFFQQNPFMQQQYFQPNMVPQNSFMQPNMFYQNPEDCMKNCIGNSLFPLGFKQNQYYRQPQVPMQVQQLSLKQRYDVLDSYDKISVGNTIISLIDTKYPKVYDQYYLKSIPVEELIKLFEQLSNTNPTLLDDLRILSKVTI